MRDYECEKCNICENIKQHKVKSTKKKACPNCGMCNAVYKERHPDTDMNEITLCCPDCGYEKEI